MFKSSLDTPQGQGWKVVASFEGVLPKRIKSLPLDQMFEISSIKKVSQLMIASFFNWLAVCCLQHNA